MLANAGRGEEERREAAGVLAQVALLQNIADDNFKEFLGDLITMIFNGDRR